MEVVIVDDDPISILYLTRTLKNLPSVDPIQTFQNGSTAFEYISKLHEDRTISEISMVFLDLNMPVMDGWEFLDELVKQSWEVSVCIVSSSVDPEDISRSGEYKNVVGFISKPVTQEKIRKVLKII